MNVSKDSNDEEMITMLEEMQDQIEDLEDQFREARDDSSRAQEEISKLSSENSLLRSELQRKSEIIVSQNEKIGMLQKSDQALEENLCLRKSNSVLKEQNSRIKNEAEVEVAVAKQKAADTLVVLSDREKRILEDEASLRQRETAFDKEVRSYAQAKISEASNQIKVHYGASIKQISDNYNKRLVGYHFLVLFTSLVKYTGYFTEKQGDEISLLAALIALALVVFAGEEVKTILSVNLLLLMLIVFAVYSLIRGIIQMENDNIRNEIIKVGGSIVGIIAGIGIMVHFFGIAGIIAIPAGLLIAASDR